MKVASPYLLVALSGTAFLSMHGVSIAQATETPAARTDDIIVTAQRRSENIQDVPIAISAFSAQDIATRGIDSLEKVAAQVPGLNFGEASGLALISIRGAGFSVITGAGDNAVAIHRDGIYIASTRAAAMFQDDLERVEVLKGPQGTLYGRNATAGVINLISRSAPTELSGEVKAGYGNYDAKSASATVGGPITDALRVRVSGSYVNRDGYIDNLTTGSKLGGIERYSVSAAIDGEIGEVFSYEIRGYQVREEFHGPVYDPIDYRSAVLPAGSFDLAPYKVRMNNDANAVRRLRGGSVALTWDLAKDVSLKSLTGYSHFQYNATYDADGTAVNGFMVAPVHDEDKSLSQEFNLIGTMDRTKFVVGAYYSDLKRTPYVHTDAPGFAGVGIATIDNVSRQNIKNYAGFFDVTYSVTDTVRLYGGLRYLAERARVFQNQTRTLTNGTVTTGCAQTLFRDKDNNLSGRGGVQFDASGDVMIYGQYATGYKSGGRSPTSCQNYYKPETLKSWEAGVKSRLFDGALTLNGAAYYYDYKNNQIEQVSGVATYIIQNADARLYGVEADAHLKLTSNFSVDAGMNLVHSEYKNFFNADRLNAAAGLQNLDGRQMIRAPKWKINVGAEFDQPLADGARITMRGDLNATAKYQLREFDPVYDAQESYVTGDASITYRFPSETFYVRGWVKNITNEAVLGGVIANGQIPGATTGPWRSGAYQMPRTYGVEVGARF